MARSKSPADHQIRPTHHIQARVSEHVRLAVAQIAAERQITESELVRDIVTQAVLGGRLGDTLRGPDNGYRIAKATAGVIAKQMLHKAYESMPEDWEGFRQFMEQEQPEE